ncbi:multicopper oxidase [Xylona heveae TC161]|uniref:Multicopper oxidase n=1 Tax=Xylona heveae (strain CBS 132557 / TC161) TaxID=1328760 RepID=A0A165AIH1_XYLHT|nr:multicopper oxidase [Xylona heveae TC161]KZF20535.1 multicopper oxidase [Xylona heveae TC161]
MSASTLAKFIVSSLNLIAALSQTATNGASLLGTLQAPKLPEFLTSNPLPAGFPWGTKTATNSNPYTQSPNTGVTRYYNFNIQRGQIAPDGYQKNVILINGQFPGPTIEANWGDMISVTVNNNIAGPEEGTSIHWYVLLQTQTPWYDGVPSVHQCPIPPGKSFTYTFKADLYGTSWYHAHYSAQYAGGLLGPMIIHGPKIFKYDVDVGPVFLSDYYHRDYFDLVKQVMGNESSPVVFSDNNLINGKMDFNCSTVTDGTPCTNNAGLSKFNFQTGKTHLLRLINAGADGTQQFSIDNHVMTVVANDFVPVQPYTTKIVTLGIGQRTDVLVTATGNDTTSVFMRSNLTCTPTNQPDALAAIYYPKANTNTRPQSTAWQPNSTYCGNDPLAQTVPIFPITPAPNPAVTQVFDMGLEVNSTGHSLWTMNQVSFRGNFNDPILLLAKSGNTSYPYDPEWNVYNLGTNQTIRFVVNNKTPFWHPMHIHGHNMYILAEGDGAWDGTIVNPNNPQRRDVQIVRPNGYMVVQIDNNNPGVWPFHCHIAWHLAGGLYANIMLRPSDIRKMNIPSTFSQTCRDWADFTSTTVVDQIDAGT